MIRRVGIALALGLLVAAIFAQVRGFDFVAYDDNRYVYENDHVRQGLSAEGARWALTTFHASNWHPLTWLAHMADVSLFGLDAGRHHVVNAALHALNAALLFWFLTLATGAAWRSALVAALFAAHPAHVESVAWVAERKDVLAAAFGMLTMIAYVHYVRRPSLGRYALVVAAFGLGLSAKSMLVTLPFVLCLLDVWPLGRISETSPRWRRIAPVVRDKIPLLALSAGVSVLTLIAQARGGAMSTIEALPLATRSAHAVVSYVSYLGMLAWPRTLAVFYPHPGVTPGGIPILKVALCFLVLAAVTWLAFRRRGDRPALLVGWLWYLGTLVPVIGLVQVGHQGIADRYTYLPSIGIFLALAWAIPDLASRPRTVRATAGVVAGLAIAAFAWLAHAQTASWRDNETLFRHAAEAVPQNWLAWKNLGVELFRQGRVDEAAVAFRRSLDARGDDADTWMNLALCHGASGRHAEAADGLRRALRLRPDDREAWFNLGVACALLRQADGAEEAVRRLRDLDPGYAGQLEARIAELASRP